MASLKRTLHLLPMSFVHFFTTKDCRRLPVGALGADSACAPTISEIPSPTCFVTETS